MLTEQFSSEIVQFLTKYLEFYSDFYALEQRKFEVITKNDIKELDGFVVKEQALMLQSRGFEQQREQLINKGADKNITLRELIPMVDDSLRAEVSELFEKLSDVLADLKEINRRSNSLVELRLHKIDSTIKSLEKQTGQAKGYNSSAKVGANPNRMSGIVSRKI